MMIGPSAIEKKRRACCSSVSYLGGSSSAARRRISPEGVKQSLSTGMVELLLLFLFFEKGTESMRKRETPGVKSPKHRNRGIQVRPMVVRQSRFPPAHFRISLSSILLRIT